MVFSQFPFLEGEFLGIPCQAREGKLSLPLRRGNVDSPLLIPLFYHPPASWVQLSAVALELI
ncbi:MAG: hypothetical protein ACP5QS_08440, partial [bacterium]